MELLLLNDNIFELEGVADEITGALIPDAVIGVTLMDLEGAPVQGQSWPSMMFPVIGEPGTYRGALAYTLQAEHLNQYRALVDINAGPGRQGHYNFKVKARIRSEV